MNAITEFIDNYLLQNGKDCIGAVEANALLEKAGILNDSKNRPGSPLRKKLRAGELPHAYQVGRKWVIPLSKKGKG